VPEQSKDNGILNDEPSSKKLKVFKPSTSSSFNPALSTILESFTSLRIKTKNLQATQCNYNNDSFELILNDFFEHIECQRKNRLLASIFL
jgi:hypothetical protein